jgi:hypothetical protein
MKIFEYKNFKIVGETYETSQSWGHKAVVFHEDTEIAKGKIRYYNRTWECYTYQSVILDAFYEAIKGRECRLIAEYKDKMGISRMTKHKKDEILQCDDYLMELNDAYKYFKDEYRG